MLLQKPRDKPYGFQVKKNFYLTTINQNAEEGKKGHLWMDTLGLHTGDVNTAATDADCIGII